MDTRCVSIVPPPRGFSGVPPARWAGPPLGLLCPCVARPSPPSFGSGARSDGPRLWRGLRACGPSAPSRRFALVGALRAAPVPARRALAVRVRVCRAPPLSWVPRPQSAGPPLGALCLCCPGGALAGPGPRGPWGASWPPRAAFLCGPCAPCRWFLSVAWSVYIRGSGGGGGIGRAGNARALAPALRHCP